MSLPLSQHTTSPAGRRHFTEDAIARREQLELLRYQQQLEETNQTLTPRGSSLDPSPTVGAKKSPPTNRSNIPNSILAHYVDEMTPEERAEKRRLAGVLSSRDDEAARELHSKILEDKIRAEQLAQIELQRRIKEEEAKLSRDLDTQINANAAAATRQAMSQSESNRRKAKDMGSYHFQAAEEARRAKKEQEELEKAKDREEAERTAEQFRQEQQAKKDSQRLAALEDQKLWGKQRQLQAVKNSPTKLLSPREKLRRTVEEGIATHEERALYQRLRDERAYEEQRQQEDKVTKQLALISATTEGTVKMTSPSNHTRLAAIDSMKQAVGMIEQLDAGDKDRLARSDAYKKHDAQHQEAVIAMAAQKGSPRRPIQNGLHSWTTDGGLLASSRRTDGAARAFESGMTMVERMAYSSDMDKERRKQDGKHIEEIQRMQAGQRRLESENERGMDRERRLREDLERKAQDEALKKHLDSVLNSYGVGSDSPKAARLRPLDSPRKNPGPGAYGNYESKSSPFRR